MILRACELLPMIHAALERGQRVRMTVTGASMLPFILDGDPVEIERVRRSPVLGDVVLVRLPGERYALHRVVRIECNAFFLRGDAQRHSEGPVMLSDILGKVVVCQRRGRKRSLADGIWRLAGLAWIHSMPLSLWLLDLAIRFREIARRSQRSA